MLQTAPDQSEGATTVIHRTGPIYDALQLDELLWRENAIDNPDSIIRSAP